MRAGQPSTTTPTPPPWDSPQGRDPKKMAKSVRHEVGAFAGLLAPALLFVLLQLGGDNKGWNNLK
jgi:hypothetical protein